jgi:putative chitinase
MINRAKFFANVRPIFGGAMTQHQVDGCEAILAEWEKRKLTDLRQLAYMLATCFWETAMTMQAIHERGPVSYFSKYNPGTRIGNALGNTEGGDGYRFRGRGYVQLTGRSNYRKMGALLKIDMEANPELALTHAAAIMFEGMIRGMFTGKKLGDYFGPGVADWRNARRIINGLDKADEIADLARRFATALNAAGQSPGKSPPIKTDSPAKPAGWWVGITGWLPWKKV